MDVDTNQESQESMRGEEKANHLKDNLGKQHEEIKIDIQQDSLEFEPLKNDVAEPQISQENTPTDGSDLNADNYLCDLEKRLTDMENENGGQTNFMISYI